MPDTPRYHGDPFNEQYEQWVRESTGGPPDREYLVEHNGERAWFDATLTEQRRGKPTEVLIDAKGRYNQFIDDETETWRPWWRDSKKGLKRTTETAERQVRVANGRPVEWWCAEEATADAFADTFDLNPNLQGKIRVKHKPMPEGGE